MLYQYFNCKNCSFYNLTTLNFFFFSSFKFVAYYCMLMLTWELRNYIKGKRKQNYLFFFFLVLIHFPKDQNFLLFSLQAIALQHKGNLMELVDPELGSEFSKEEALIMIKVALIHHQRLGSPWLPSWACLKDKQILGASIYANVRH